MTLREGEKAKVGEGSDEGGMESGSAVGAKLKKREKIGHTHAYTLAGASWRTHNDDSYSWR